VLSSSIGLPRRIVRLAPYRRDWKAEFRSEKKSLKQALRSLAIDIQHIGSTSVPKLAGKPIIDIAVAVNSLKEVRKCVKPLKGLGYVYMGQNGVAHQRIFVKGSESNRTHYVHFVEFGGSKWRDYLLFRDALVADSGLRAACAERKLALQKKFPRDRPSYTNGKGRFISATLRRFREAR
jgi:GrpB-like predicted nucleotidyltransferase (UPF0157 family)